MATAFSLSNPPAPSHPRPPSDKVVQTDDTGAPSAVVAGGSSIVPLLVVGGLLVGGYFLYKKFSKKS